MYFEYGEKEISHLKKRDKKLSFAIDKIGHIHRKVNDDLFSTIVNSIIGQQISTKAQETIWGRLLGKIDEVNAKNILNLDIKDLQSIGITNKKAEYIFDFAKKVHDKKFYISSLYDMTDEEVIKELSSLKGIGVWTAQMVMIFCMQRKDILSFKDLAIHRGMKILYNKENINKNEFEKYRKKYSPYNSIASLYLWSIAGGALDNFKEKINFKEDIMENFAIAETKLGFIKIVYENNKVIRLDKVEKTEILGKKTDFSDKVFSQLEEYFSGKRREFDIEFEFKGTEFQEKVWRELLKIPYGETATYKEIAKRVGNEKASRAVGLANNKNPIAIIVPCHRVVGSDGKLVGYAGGLDMKKFLLDLEKQTSI